MIIRLPLSVILCLSVQVWRLLAVVAVLLATISVIQADVQIFERFN
ncbi:hypothetical protein KHA96_03435 [Bacillus sp. FJAT-49711]|nr:hypothetical protein [Bacillus sp. FJAT-49711]MBS4217363.1 hypothetical protein [Bacillus sp. FJAT-49711]